MAKLGQGKINIKRLFIHCHNQMRKPHAFLGFDRLIELFAKTNILFDILFDLSQRCDKDRTRIVQTVAAVP